MASVWTPYEFYFNGTFSHCGANSFQLFKEDNQWKIIFLVDIRRRENCKALKEMNADFFEIKYAIKKKEETQKKIQRLESPLYKVINENR